MPNQQKAPTPTDAQRARAASFAEWQTAARKRKGWGIPDLHRSTNYSDSQVRLYDQEGYAGIDSTGKYRQPSEEYVQKVAEATGADELDGLERAGLVRVVREQPRVFQLTYSDGEQIVLEAGSRILIRDREGEPGTALDVDDMALDLLKTLARRQQGPKQGD